MRACGIIVCVMEFGGNLEGERTRGANAVVRGALGRVRGRRAVGAGVAAWTCGPRGALASPNVLCVRVSSDRASVSARAKESLRNMINAGPDEAGCPPGTDIGQADKDSSNGTLTDSVEPLAASNTTVSDLGRSIRVPKRRVRALSLASGQANASLLIVQGQRQQVWGPPGARGFA